MLEKCEFRQPGTALDPYARPPGGRVSNPRTGRLLLRLAVLQRRAEGSDLRLPPFRCTCFACCRAAVQLGRKIGVPARGKRRCHGHSAIPGRHLCGVHGGPNVHSYKMGELSWSACTLSCRLCGYSNNRRGLTPCEGYVQVSNVPHPRMYGCTALPPCCAMGNCPLPASATTDAHLSSLCSCRTPYG